MSFLYSHAIFRKKNFILLERHLSGVVCLLPNDGRCAGIFVQGSLYLRILEIASERRLPLSTVNLGQRNEDCDRIHIYTHLVEKIIILSLLLQRIYFFHALIFEGEFQL